MALDPIYQRLVSGDKARFQEWQNSLQEWLSGAAGDGEAKQKISNWISQGLSGEDIASKMVADALMATGAMNVLNPKYIERLTRYAPQIYNQWELMQRATGTVQNMAEAFPQFFINWLGPRHTGGYGWGALTPEEWRNYFFGGGGIPGLLPQLQAVQEKAKAQQPLTEAEQQLFVGLPLDVLENWHMQALRSTLSPLSFQSLAPRLHAYYSVADQDLLATDWLKLLEELGPGFLPVR